MKIARFAVLSWSGFSWRRGRFGFQARDFGEEGSGFLLQRSFQRLVVGVGHFAGLEFEVQITQVFVDGVFSVAQVGRASLLRAEIEGARIKDVEERGDGS